MENRIKVAELYEFPGLRHCKTSDDSGEEFYHKILNSKFYDAYKNDEKLIVDLDGTSGFAPSFLDEAFGKLVYDFTLKLVDKHLILISDEEPDWIEMLVNETFDEWEKRRLRQEKPKITGKHDSWKSIKDGVVVEINE